MKKFIASKTFAIALAVFCLLPWGTQAQSLYEALTNAELSGRLSFRHIESSSVSPGTAQVNASINHNKHVSSAALALDYLSDGFHGFNLGIGFQHGVDFETHASEGGAPWSSEDDSRNSIDSTNLHTAFLEYSFANTNVRVGRQEIEITPLLMSSDMFPVRDSFEGVVIKNRDIHETTVKLFAIKHWIKRYGSDSNGGDVQEDYTFDDGLWSIWAKSNALERVILQGQYLSFNARDTDNIGDPPVNTPAGISGARRQWFISAAYELPVSHTVTVEGKYLGVDYDPANEDDTYMWGAKVTSKIGSTGLKLAYEAVGEENMYPGTIGHVPVFGTYAGGPFIITDPLFAGMSSLSAAVSHNPGIPGLHATLNYAHFRQSREGVKNSTGEDFDGASELLLDLSYTFQDFKGLSIRAFLSYMNYDVSDAADDEMTYARLFLDYQF